MALSDVQIRTAKPSDKPRKISDGRGLFPPIGGKYWRLKYRIAGSEKLFSIGVYPDISLKQARTARDEARKLIAQGIDPSSQKKAEKLTEGGAECFEAITREWFDKFSPTWATSHATKIFHRFEKDLFPYLSKRPLKDINAPELLAVLRRIETRGAIETTHRAKQNIGQVFRYAVATGRANKFFESMTDMAGAKRKECTKEPLIDSISRI